MNFLLDRVEHVVPFSTLYSNWWSLCCAIPTYVNSFSFTVSSRMHFDDDYISLKMDDYDDVEDDVEAALKRARRKRRRRRKRRIKKKHVAIAAVAVEDGIKVLEADELPQRARWTIVATACLLLFMCLLLVGVTLRMAPIIDDMGKFDIVIHFERALQKTQTYLARRPIHLHLNWQWFNWRLFQNISEIVFNFAVSCLFASCQFRAQLKFDFAMFSVSTDKIIAVSFTGRERRNWSENFFYKWNA